jgi:hypothetical protein
LGGVLQNPLRHIHPPSKFTLSEQDIEKISVGYFLSGRTSTCYKTKNDIAIIAIKKRMAPAVICWRHPLLALSILPITYTPAHNQLPW